MDRNIALRASQSGLTSCSILREHMLRKPITTRAGKLRNATPFVRIGHNYRFNPVLFRDSLKN